MQWYGFQHGSVLAWNGCHAIAPDRPWPSIASRPEHLRYHLSKPQPDGTTELSLTPVELIDRIAALVPPPRGWSGLTGAFPDDSRPDERLRALARSLAAVVPWTQYRSWCG